MEPRLVIIPSDEEVNLCKIWYKKGWCDICRKDACLLRRHFENKHCDIYGVQIQPHITIIPEEEGQLDPNEIIWGIGTCQRIECKTEVQHLRKHYLEHHDQRAVRMLRSIPVDREVRPYEIITTKGWCDICKEHKITLRHHFQAIHCSKSKLMQIQPHITVIPEEEGQLDLNEIIWGIGTCQRIECKTEVQHLRKHYLEHHGQRPVGVLRSIPADREVRRREICSAKGWCDICRKEKCKLRRHFVDMHCDIYGVQIQPHITIIPEEEGQLDPNEIIWGIGTCQRIECKTEVQHLRKHYLEHHYIPPKNLVVLLRCIPTDREVRPHEVCLKIGKCGICKIYRPRLREHFLVQHCSPYGGQIEPHINVITEKGELNANEIVMTSGICRRPQCKRKVVRLRSHYVTKHQLTFRKGPTRVIMENQNCNAARIYSGFGWCDICKVNSKRLRSHFLQVHYNMAGIHLNGM